MFAKGITEGKEHKSFVLNIEIAFRDVKLLNLNWIP